MNTDIKLAAKNFLLTYYKTSDIETSVKTASEYILNDSEIDGFINELISYFDENSDIDLEVIEGEDVVPIKVEADSSISLFLSGIFM